MTLQFRVPPAPTRKPPIWAAPNVDNCREQLRLANAKPDFFDIVKKHRAKLSQFGEANDELEAPEKLGSAIDRAATDAGVQLDTIELRSVDVVPDDLFAHSQIAIQGRGPLRAAASFAQTFLAQKPGRVPEHLDWRSTEQGTQFELLVTDLRSPSED